MGLEVFEQLGSKKTKDALHTFQDLAKPTNKNALQRQVAQIVVNGLKEIGDEISNGQNTYLRKTYYAMWETAPYLTGNMRGALCIVGDVKKNFFDTDIDLDEAEFVKSKKLKVLRTMQHLSSYKTKSGKKKSYVTTRIKKGSEITVGGDYLWPANSRNVTSRHPVSVVVDNTDAFANGLRIGGEFIYSCWQEIKRINHNEYQVTNDVPVATRVKPNEIEEE